eukprot:g83209.t1
MSKGPDPSTCKHEYGPILGPALLDPEEDPNPETHYQCELCGHERKSWAVAKMCPSSYKDGEHRDFSARVNTD